MFEMAKDQIIEDGRYEILGGYYSPVCVLLCQNPLSPPSLLRARF